MIKWRTNIAGQETVGIGLTVENVAKLRRGYPVIVKGHEIGLDFDILIHYGLNEQTMLKDLQEAGMVTEQTTIHKT
jgi:hypothetical protein